MSLGRAVFAAAIALAVVACTDAPVALETDLEPAFAIAQVFTNPSAFATATATLGVPTVIDFDDIDASPINNSIAGRRHSPSRSPASLLVEIRGGLRQRPKGMGSLPKGAILQDRPYRP